MRLLSQMAISLVLTVIVVLIVTLVKEGYIPWPENLSLEFILFLLLPTPLWIFALYQLLRSGYFITYGRAATATIVGMSRRQVSRVGECGFPMLEFQDSTGRKHRFESKQGSPQWGDEQIGTTKAILYLPNHPEQGRLADWKALWLPGCMIAFVAAALTVIMAFQL